MISLTNSSPQDPPSKSGYMTPHERHPAIRSRCIGGALPRPARPVIPPRKLHVGLDPCLLVPVTDLDKRCPSFCESQRFLFDKIRTSCGIDVPANPHSRLSARKCVQVPRGTDKDSSKLPSGRPGVIPQADAGLLRNITEINQMQNI